MPLQRRGVVPLQKRGVPLQKRSVVPLQKRGVPLQKRGVVPLQRRIKRRMERGVDGADSAHSTHFSRGHNRHLRGSLSLPRSALRTTVPVNSWASKIRVRGCVTKS